MLLRDLLDERGLSDEEAASILAEHGVTIRRGERAGDPITAEDIKRRRGGEISRLWAPAFGIEVPPDSTPRRERAARAPRDRTDSPPGRFGELPPSRPPGAPIEVLDTAGARRRIAGAYKFAGAALAAGSGSEGVAHVWADQSDPIAELWVQAAAENEWAARFVNVMSAGGTVGDLAAAHLYLAGATLYVLGAAIPAGDSIFAKYRPHRAVPAPAASNGHAGAGGRGDEPARPEPEVAESPAPGAVEFDQG